MLGAILLVFLMAFVFPPLLMATGGAIAGLFSWIGTADGETRYEGTEWVELSRR